MNSLTRFSIKSPAVIVIAIIMIIIGGIYSARQLSLETMPDLEIPIVTVATIYPGAAPSEILEEVTKPLEKSIRNIEGAKNKTSTSSDNVSVIILEFEFGDDMDKVKRDVEEAVKAVNLPEAVQAPKVGRISFDAMPIMRLAIAGKNSASNKIDQFVKKEVIPGLQGIDGVANVELATEQDESIKIKLLPEKLKENNLNSQQVSQFLVANNLALPAGELLLESQVLPVTVGQKFDSIDSIKNLPLAVFPSSQEGMENALSGIGKGMEGLGRAVGDIGAGMGSLGQGLAGVQGQVQMVSGIQELQAAVLTDKLALSQLESKSQKAALRQKIAAEEGQLAQLKGQLAAVQAAMGNMSAGAPPAGGSSRGSMPRAQTGAQAPEIRTITLGEIAEISRGSDEALVVSRLNSRPAVGVNIVKDAEANTVKVADGVNEKLDELRRSGPKDMNIKVVEDQSAMVRESLSGLLREGIMGAILAMLVILVFLGNWRSTLIAVVSIPLSVLISLIVIRQFGITLNIMTLAGMAVAIGRVVDDSIVVIENIYRHRQKDDLKGAELVKTGTSEVSSAITSSTFTVVGVFVPLALISGFIGQVFVPFAIAAVSSIMASLLVALTVVPLMAKYLIAGKTGKSGREVMGLAVRYTSLLRWALNHKLVVLATAFGFFAASLGLATLIGSNFLPPEQQKNLNVAIEMPSGTAFDVLDKKTSQVEDIIKDDAVKSRLVTVGKPMGQMGMLEGVVAKNVAGIFVELKEDTDINDFTKKIRAKIKKIEGSAKIGVSEAGQMAGGMGQQIEVLVEGDNIGKLRRAANKITARMREVDDLVNIKDNLAQEKTGVDIQIDAEKAAKEGLTSAQVGTWLRDLFVGKNVTRITMGDEGVDVEVGLKQSEIQNLEEMNNLELQTPMGKTIKLGDIAEVRKGPIPVSITRRDEKQFASLTGDITTANSGEVSREVRAEIDKLDLGKGVTAKLAGVTEMMDEGFSQLGIAMVIAIGVVYLIMVLAFGEALAPLSILFSLPFAATGALIGLFISKQQINVSSMIGGLMLIGIVVTNAIVMIERVQQRRSIGISTREALLEAGTTRFRPILMTAVSTIFALLPLGLGLSEGGLISQSLAVAVIGGLTTSTVLTLFITPVVFEILADLRAKLIPATSTVDAPPKIFAQESESEGRLSGINKS